MKKNTFIYFLFLTILFLPGCEKKKDDPIKLTLEERSGLESFLKTLMLKEGGVYVLFGSKPMVSFSIPVLSSEEDKKIYDNFFEREKGKISKFPVIYLKGWEQVKDRIPMHRYIIVQRKTLSEKVDEILFISITNTIEVLLKNYDYFQKAIGYEFSPNDVVFEIEDPSSNFWKKVFSDEILAGLLFGYGEKNAVFFKLWSESKSDLNERSSKYWEHIKFDLDQSELDHRHSGNITSKNFPLPIYRSFGNDSVREKYKKEREEIIKFYERKDFLEVTLKELTE